MIAAETLKDALRGGSRPVGCWIFLTGGDSTELLSHLGFDFFIVDHEHTLVSSRDLVDQMRAARGGGVPCLVRVPSHDPVPIKRALDAGVEGIVVPTVETAEQARAIVAACRYRPHGGNRGVGYPESRAADWGVAELEYPRVYRDRLLVAVIVETRLGVENVDEIAAVEGIDVIIPGTGDLLADIVPDFDSLSGYGGYHSPELDALVERIELAARRHSKWLCGVNRTAGGAKAMLDRGYDMVTATADNWLLMDAARQVMAELGRKP